MLKVVVAVVMLMMLLLSGLTHTESWMTRVLPSRQEEIKFVHEQVTDIAWILVLCLFSALVRFRHRRGVRLYLLAAAFLLLTLAALHSHPLWNRGTALAEDSWQGSRNLTRIIGRAATVQETGLRLDDVVTAMSFDGDGNLWLSTPSNGPYCYLVHTGEMENMLRPDAVYGFYPDAGGMWVMTSSGAFLYRGPGIIRSVRFPDGVIPLSAIHAGNKHLFGTTRGLFSARAGDAAARLEMAGDRIIHLYPIRGGVLVAGDSGLWRWTSRGTARCAQIRHHTLSGIVGSSDRILAGTMEDGILALRPRPVTEIRFAVPELNIVSPGAAAMHQGKPCFGTYAGALVYQDGKVWRKADIGEYPVTALVSDGEMLYAWSGGRLLAVKL